MGALHQAMLMYGASAGGTTTLIFDDFNRANSGTLGTCTSGTQSPQAWAGAGSGGFAIVSNRAVFTHGTPSYTYRFLNVGTADCTVKATLVTAKPDNKLWFRGDSPDGFLFGVDGTGTKYECYKVQSGTFTAVWIGTAGAPTPTDGDIVEVVLSGTSIIFKVNGVTLSSVTDSYKQTLPNMGFYGGNAGSNDGGTWDDFTVTLP